MDKPVGPSSFSVVREIGGATGARAGHAGTLDPFASGLLLVLLGAATRLARYLVGLDKRYVTEIDLTARTATGDREGEVVADSAPIERDELEAGLESLRGEVELRIPAASAVKIGGERAYRLARRGVAVDMPLRRSTVYELRLLEAARGRALLDMRVSSGTYVRSIADALGGHCLTLRRLEVGPFRLENADPARILPPSQAVGFLPAVSLGTLDAGLVRTGRAVAGEGEGLVRLLAEGSLIAVGQAADGLVRPETVLR